MKVQFLTLLTLLFSLTLLSQNRLEIKCDSIYKNKEILIRHLTFDSENDGYDGSQNSVLMIEQNRGDNNIILLQDSIYSRVQKIEFIDYNQDHIKDVLIPNTSDVRSNWTYYLYLYDPKTNNFIKVNGFEKIKNPKYHAKYNIIESYVMSGQDSVSFYKISNNRIHDYKIEIIDDHGQNFEGEYNRAIKKMTSSK